MRLIVAVTASLLASAAAAHDFRAGDLIVAHPYGFPAPAAAPSAIGYMAITNTGDAPDRLIAVESPFEAVTLHRTEVDASGIARMLSEAGGIEIAPGETFVMAPGGSHVMFEGLRGDALEAGERIDATLVFERAGRLDVQFLVEPRGAEIPEADPSAHAMEGMDHGDTGHGDGTRAAPATRP